MKRFRAISNIKWLSNSMRNHGSLRVLTQRKDRQKPRPPIGDNVQINLILQNGSGISLIKNLRDPVFKIKAESDSQTQL